MQRRTYSHPAIARCDRKSGTCRVATINDAGLAAVCALTQLTHLDLSGSHDVTDAGARTPDSCCRS